MLFSLLRISHLQLDYSDFGWTFSSNFHLNVRICPWLLKSVNAPRVLGWILYFHRIPIVRKRRCALNHENGCVEYHTFSTPRNIDPKICDVR